MTRLDAKRLEIVELIAIELGFDGLEGLTVEDREMVDQHADEAIMSGAAYLSHPADSENSNIRLRMLLRNYLIMSKLETDQDDS
jgi:hypothetical protein